MRLHRLAFLPVLLAVAATLVAPAHAGGDTGFLLRQADLEVARLTGDLPEDTRHWQGDFGGGSSMDMGGGGGRSPAIPMLMSLLVPGAGEVYLGYKRGFLQIALDAASWYGAIHYNDEGDRKADEYYAYADLHWSEGKLDAAYDSDDLDRPDANFQYSYMVGDGTDYFDVDGYTDLPLWVSVEADRREYYENLGKWDQFVFGWDDYTDPRDFMDTEDIDIGNLDDPRTSANRETYRQMRKDSNDAYAKKDQFVYLSIAFRVFSVLQVAYLEGLLFGGGGGGGDGGNGLQVGSHQVDFFVEPVGYSRGVLGATVSF
jgi:hypothetical protein